MSTSEFHTIDVRLDADGQVLWLRLNQPKANVLTMEMVAELDAVLEAYRDRRELRLVVLRGAGGQFSYGASVEEHRKELAPAMLEGFHRFIRRLAGYPVPTAALVEGRCLGGGFEVALVCHFLFATANARFACPEIKLGVYPPVLAAIGDRRLGGLVSERLLLTGGELDAEEAERLGLLTSRFEAGEDPETALLAWYRRELEPLSAFALRQGARATRVASGFLEALDRGLAASERQYVDEVLASHDGNEGVEAFLAKRPPRWTNA